MKTPVKNSERNPACDPVSGGAAAFEIRCAVIMIPDREKFLSALRTVMQRSGTVIICFDAGAMAGRRHAETAVARALRSFASGSPIAKTLEMEALLYASGTRQCSEAGIVGVHEGENHAFICCCPARPEVWMALEPLVQFVDDSYDTLDPIRVQRLRSLYSITDQELAAAGGESRLADLVIERVVLLDAYR